MIKDQEYDYFYKDSDKYCYPGSIVLVNKLGITNLEKLRAAERDISGQRYYSLLKMGVTGDFSLNHLCAIHKYLFQDIYEWAGKIRTVDIAKGDIFCLVQFIELQFSSIYEQLRKENFLKDISEHEEMTQRLAYYLSEVNAIHPFREGNGRTQRVYIQQICQNNGRFAVDFSLVSSDDMVAASKAAFNLDYNPMEKVISKCLIPGSY